MYLYRASAEYALHSLLILVARAEPVSVRDLARFQELPVRYLAKLFTKLQKSGLVKGIEGIHGGFALARPPAEITVRDVLDAVDPNCGLFQCGEIRRHCALYEGEPPAWSVAGMCRIHLFMKEAEDVLREYLASKTLADLGDEYTAKAPGQFLQDTQAWFVDRRDERTANRRGNSQAGRNDAGR